MLVDILTYNRYIILVDNFIVFDSIILYCLTDLLPTNYYLYLYNVLKPGTIFNILYYAVLFCAKVHRFIR